MEVLQRARRLSGWTALSMSAVLVAASLAELMSAYIFSGGNEQIPYGTVETTAWFAFPLAALASSIVAVSSSRRLLRGRSPRKELILTAASISVSVVCLAGWFVLGSVLVDPGGTRTVPAP